MPQIFACEICESYYWQGVELTDVAEFDSTGNPEVKKRLQEFIDFWDAEAKKHKETHKEGNS